MKIKYIQFDINKRHVSCLSFELPKRQTEISTCLSATKTSHRILIYIFFSQISEKLSISEDPVWWCPNKHRCKSITVTVIRLYLRYNTLCRSLWNSSGHWFNTNINILSQHGEQNLWHVKSFLEKRFKKNKNRILGYLLLRATFIRVSLSSCSTRHRSMVNLRPICF